MLMKRLIQLSLVLAMAVGLTSCMSDSQLKEKMGRILEKNPELITKLIEKNPTKFVEAFQKAVQEAQENMAKKREEAERKQLEDSYKNPLKPEIRKDETFRGGPKDAPLMLVEYSDFECPFCTRGFNTVRQLLEKYGDKITFVFKHLPLNFHPQALPASQYYEAIRLQSEEKAFKFHDMVFDNQRKLKNGKKFLDSVAKKLKVDMKKLAKDIESEKVNARIQADQKEAQKFGMQGTPGFVLNGIPIRGAYPIDHFENIIAELKKRGKVKM